MRRRLGELERNEKKRRAEHAKRKEWTVSFSCFVSTIDFTCPTGNDIPIEERDQNEVLDINGLRVASKGSQALNPAFDVTPAKYITGIITEQGIFKPGELDKINR